MDNDTKQSTVQVLSFDETINRVALRPMHWRIWALSAMGIWMEGFNLFVIGIALPLIKYQYNPSPFEEGLIGSSVIIGTILGSVTLGRLADIYGRKKVLLWNAIIVTISTILAGTAQNLYLLMLFLLVVGLGVGADYPICASYVAELMPSRIRGKMLIGAFSFQAAGMLTAALVGFITLKLYPSEQAWHYILASGSVPAILISIFRITVPESPRWCIENGKAREAMRTISQLSTKSKEKIYKIIMKEEKKIQKKAESNMPVTAMFSKEYIRRTILSTVPWFLMDIATYGVGIFTPTIIASLIESKGTSIIDKDIFSIAGSAFTYIFLILGFLANIALVEKAGRIRLQLLGFIGMAIGLVILALSTVFKDGGSLHMILLFGGFIVYSFLMNMGPNATTFILPAELYPTKLRATAHGFSASFAKIGAVVGIIFLPVMESCIGMYYTVLLIASTAILGYIVTAMFKVETTGKSLDTLSHFEAARAMDHLTHKRPVSSAGTMNIDTTDGKTKN